MCTELMGELINGDLSPTDEVAKLAALPNEAHTHALFTLRSREGKVAREVAYARFGNASEGKDGTLKLGRRHLREVICLILVRIRSAMESGACRRADNACVVA